ncbi:MAG: zinc metallopeptidase [Clostridiales bacterium]|nr:zinc metallopeptidase [Clostridiales bacterium]
MGYYFWFLIALMACAVFSMSASNKVKTTFRAFKKVPTSSRMTGYDTAVRLLRANGVDDISVRRVGGELTDHYHPTKGEVNLSASTFGDDSVGAVAVAAHEIGHVMQKKKGYIPYKLRSFLVPVCNVGSRLALPLVLIGLLIDVFVYAGQGSNLGYALAMFGVVLYGLSTLFMLVTLPVEFDASRRAKKMLVEEGILTEEEALGADKVLDAAALTYVAALATSLVYFLRFLVWVLMMFGRRNRN